MSSYLKIDSTLNTSVSFPNASFVGVGTGSASFAVWVRISDKNISGVLFQKYDGSSGYQAKFNEELNGDLSLEFLVDGTTSASTKIDNVPVKLDEWQLYVFVIDKAGNLRIYIDAVIHADTNSVSTPAGNIDNSDDFYIGFDSTNPSSSQSGFLHVDSFSFYDDILDEFDISYVYNKGRGRKIDGTEIDIVFGLNLDEGTGAIITDEVVSSTTGAITSNASPFNNVWSETGGVDVMHPSDIELYLTSLEPGCPQTNYSQSIGGHISTSRMYPQTTFASAVGLYDTSIEITDASDLLGYEYISMGNEIAKVESITGTTVTVTERGVNGTIGYYSSATIVQGGASPLSDAFNEDRKQYRCYAVKNISSTETAYDTTAYFKQLSENTNTTIKLALEYPKSQGIAGTSTIWTSSMLIDSSLDGTYVDNFFVDSYMLITSGPNSGYTRRINSYDGSTGAFVFGDSLTTDYDSSLYSNIIGYTVDASPSQRVKDGTTEPPSTDYISDFSSASSRDLAVQLVSLDGTGSIAPGEIIYVWIERGVGKSNASYDENSFVLSIDFTKELEGN